jgi:hypothetical protein
MIIVGIGHKSRQGKDELANFLCTHLRVHTRNRRIVKVGFADILKNICYQLYSWAGVHEPDYYERHPAARDIIIEPLGYNVVELWIRFGNHCREFHEPIWINALLKGTKADVLIIKDTRFPNETKAIHEHGGLLVKVNRPGHEGLPSVSDNALNGFDGWDRVLENNKDLKHLHDLAVSVAEDYVMPKLG